MLYSKFWKIRRGVGSQSLSRPHETNYCLILWQSTSIVNAEFLIQCYFDTMSAGSSGVEAVPLHKATPEQLEKEFFPPRPDPELAPEQFKLCQERSCAKNQSDSPQNTLQNSEMA